MAMNGLQQARMFAQNPAAAAMMLAAARHKSETAGGNVDQEQAAANDKAHVLVNLTTGTVSTKDQPIEDYVAKKQQAMDAPHEEVSNVLAQHGAALSSADGATPPATAGTTPGQAPSNPAGVLSGIIGDLTSRLDPAKIREQLSTYRGRLSAARELGANPITAQIDAGRIAVGLISKDSAVQQVIMARAQKLKQFQSSVGGVIDDQRIAANEATQGRNALAAQARTDQVAARQRRSDLAKSIKTSTLGDLNPESVGADTGLDPNAIANDPAIVAAMEQKRNELTLAFGKNEAKRRRDAVGSLKRDTYDSGQTFEQWKTDTENQVGALTPSETSQAQSKWKAFAKKAADEGVTKQQAADRDARAASAAERTANGPAEAPSHEWPTAQLIDAKGDPTVKQHRLYRAANRRAGVLNDKVVSNSDAAKKIDAQVIPLQTEITALKANPGSFAQGKLLEKQSKLDTLRAKRDALRQESSRYGTEIKALNDAGFGGAAARAASTVQPQAASPVPAPQKGDIRTYPNGAKAMFDGQGWAQIK